MRWLIAGADLSSPDCVVGDGKSVSAATTTTSVMMIYTIRAVGRETLCLRADGDEESNCFIRTKQLAFSLYGRTRRRLPNAMECHALLLIFLTIVGIDDDEFTGMLQQQRFV